MKWTESQLKFIARLRYGETLPKEVEETGGFRVYGSNGPFAQSPRANTAAPAIVIGRKGSYGKINWSDDPCFASDTTFYIDESRTKHDLRWLYWLLQTLRLDEGTDETAVPGLSRDFAHSRQVRVPPLGHQRSIAAYLDHETVRLDALTAEEESVVNLLAEKRDALITRAASRGLDPSVRLRDSDVPWLGPIPAHWDVWKLGHAASIGNGSTPRRGNADYWDAGTIPWLNSSIVNEEEATKADQFVTRMALQECHLPLVEPGSVLMAITGQGKTRGRAVVLSFPATINQHLAYVTSDPSVLNPWFLRWTLLSAYGFLRCISDSAGGTKGALTCEDVANLRVPVPPMDEQLAVVGHIAKAVRAIDDLYRVVGEGIDLLKERRRATIAAAVTGRVALEN